MSSLSSLKLKSRNQVVAAPILTVTPKNTTIHVPGEGFQKLLTVPGITKHLVPEIIPDLLDIISENDGVKILTQMIEESEKNPDTPLIFFHPTEKKYKATQEIERDMLLNLGEMEVTESELYQCSNPACRSRFLLVARVQTRSADEALSLILFCTKCKKKETRKG